MRAREVGWIAFLSGLPLAPFVWRLFSRWPTLDLWHGQEVWAMGWTATLSTLSFWSGATPTVSNKPLACWLLWVALSGWWMFTDSTVATKQYPLPLLLPLLFGLSIMAFYHAATQMWDVAFLTTLLRWMAWVSVLVMAYSLLQLAGLDQFLKDIDTGKQSRLVGTIGNPTHLASYLAFTLPLLLLQQGWWWKGMAGVNLCLVAISSSIGGQVAAVAALSWWCYWQQRAALKWVGPGVVLAGVYAWFHHAAVFNPYGRWQAWSVYWDIFRNMKGAQPITGLGLGFVYTIVSAVQDATSPIYHWHHVHQEWLQLGLELGVIGVGLALWALVDIAQWFIRLPKTPLLVACTAILLAAVVNSQTTFPFHLWMLSSVLLTAYAGVYVIAQESQK